MANLGKSIRGRELGQGRVTGELLVWSKGLGGKTGDVTITVAAEVSNVRAITIQLKDWRGNNITYVEKFELGMYLDATPSDFVASGGSTGVAIGANGKLLAVIAKKLFHGLTDATGKWTGTWTDTGTEAFAIGVRLPNGRLVMGTVQANT